MTGTDTTATAATSAAPRLTTRLRAFFESPIRYAWVTLLVPTLFALKYAGGHFDPTPDYPGYLMAWIFHFVPFALMLVPIQLTYAHVFDRHYRGDPMSPRAIPLHLALIVGVALVGLVIGGALVTPFMPPAETDPTGEWREIPFLMFLATVLGTPIAVRGIYYRWSIEEGRARELAAQRAVLAAQVQALQARIEPHFLFNSLNVAASLVREDPERAERALETIAKLFRYALDASTAPTVPLALELESAEAFLELAKLRFPDRLATSVRIEPGTGDVAVPPLFLQPLVENALQHGIAPRREPGRIELEISRGAQLQVRVEDDGPGPGGSTHRGAGAALSDLRKRLALLYGERASLEVDRGELGGFRVRLSLPLESMPAEESA